MTITASLLATGLFDGLKRLAAGMGLPPAISLRLPAPLSLRLPERHVHIVQAVQMGPGARLVVVEFGGRRLLIGQSRAGLATLADQPMS